MPEEEGGIRGAEVSISTDAHVLGAGMGKGVGVTGIITGLAVFSAEGAQRCYQANQACILIQQAGSIKYNIPTLAEIIERDTEADDKICSHTLSCY